MSGDPRIERRLPGILADLGAGAPPDYTDTILVRTAVTRQRPGWVFPGRWVPMTAITERLNAAPRVPWRALALAALLLIGLVATALYVGSRRQLPPPFGPAGNGVIPYVANGDIYVGDPVTGVSRLLVGGPETDASPQYSPDGTRVTFTREVGTTTIRPIDIYVVRDDGTGLTKITPKPLWDGPWISWTPDGRSLAVVSTGDLNGNKLDLYDAAGTGLPRMIAAVPGMDFVQFRPPDGRELLYRALVNGKWGLFARNPDGSNPRTLAAPTIPQAFDNAFGRVVYSADGRHIYYEHAATNPDEPNGCCQLWEMNADDGGNDHEFIPQLGAPGTEWRGQPVVSPDGARVAYWHNHNDRPTQRISVANTDGTGPVIQTGPELPAGAHWLWSPDSSKILMYPVDYGHTAYLLDPDGGPYSMVPWQSEMPGPVGLPAVDWQRIAAH